MQKEPQQAEGPVANTYQVHTKYRIRFTQLCTSEVRGTLTNTAIVLRLPRHMGKYSNACTVIKGK